MTSQGMVWEEHCPNIFGETTWMGILQGIVVIRIFQSKSVEDQWCIKIRHSPSPFLYLPTTYTLDQVQAWAIATWRMG